VLRGHLLDGDGRPAAGRRLYASEPDLDNDSNPSDRDLRRFTSVDDMTTTDADGRFELSGFRPGTYALVVSDWIGIGSPLRFGIAAARVTEIEFRLPPAARVEIQASQARPGQVIEIVHCDASSSDDLHARAWSQRRETDGLGRAVIAPAPGGRHRIGIDQVPDCDQERGTAIQLEPGRTLALALTSATTPTPTSVERSVRVLAADGSPAVHALVEVDHLRLDGALPTRVDWTFAPHLAITDADGRARIRVRFEGTEPQSVTAVRRAEFAAAWLEPDGGELTLRLQRSTAK
jgi:hypothetical protein